MEDTTGSEPARWLVVPVDDPGDASRSIDTAVDLAGRIGAGVRLLSIVESEDGVTRRQTELTAIAAGITGLVTDVEVVQGTGVAAVIVAITGPRDIVCMTTAASLLPHKGHFGSIAEDVVRRIDRPVVLLGPKADPSLSQGLTRVIVPVDGSARSEAAIKPAAALAGFLGLPLWIVTVVPVAAQRAAAAQLGVEAAATESGYVRVLAREAAQGSDLETQFEVLHITDAADAILDFARGTGLVVMSTHGKSGLARLFAGSVATSVVARSVHPVVVLRPSDDALTD
ncbi:MAG: universal stress protein [Acidimicrobiia bacterium]